MVCIFLLDLVMRFVPLDSFTFRATEAVLRRYPNAEGPFPPNKHYHRDNSYGVVAAVGNLPALRHYHPADFTSDAYGYRNPPALAHSNPIGIVIGDSFVIGSELPEDQTLSAQLTRLSGGYFYNAGALQPLRLGSLQSIAQRLGLHRGIVVCEFLESHATQKPPATTPYGGRGWAQSLILRAGGPSWVDRLGLPLNQLHDSPLQGLSIKLEKYLQNGDLLPNSFAGSVILGKLRNGDSIAFLPGEFRTPADAKEAAGQWAAYFSWYSAELHKDGLDLIVLLVPNRSTIYAPLLAQPIAVSASRATLDQFDATFTHHGIQTISLLNPYEHEAEAILNQHEYLYFLDDTHWNTKGVALAATQILAHRPE